jgi:hypothetical protein
LPRSPLVSAATRELAQYFKATTDAAFIDRSWSINTVSSDDATRTNQTSKDLYTKIDAYGDVYRAGEEYQVGTPIADHIANLLNGPMCIGSFQRISGMWPLPTSPNDYGAQLQLYYMEEDKALTLESSQFFSDNPDRNNINLYAATVRNPYLGPMTKDIGALEVFMNGIPTLELSKCVPYLNVELISLNRTAGTVAPPLTLLGFLNPSSLSAADRAMINGNYAEVRSETMKIGPGLRSGMELFTAPQTLVNMGPTGATFLPVIDPLVPLASLGNLSLSTKLQGGTMNFTTGRLEITVHDRSRLREVAALVRPDLYGTTFLDITHGWSHPEGGANSPNSFGKFLDALKTTTRFRIAGSTYSFEEGQIKITLNIQTVGSTDLLYIGPGLQESALRKMQQLIRDLNDVLVEMNAKKTTPSMAEYDFLSAFQDPSSALAASLDKDVIKKLQGLINSNKTPTAVKSILRAMVGESKDLVADEKKPADVAGAIGAAQDALAGEATKFYNSIIGYDQDTAFGTLPENKFSAMYNNTFFGEVDGVSKELTQVSGSNNVVDKLNMQKSDFISYGAAFMKLIAEPLAKLGQYDEVQVIFYPFNKYAGAVFNEPVSSFPIERARFKEALTDLSKRVPNVSARQIIGMMYDRFTHFLPARAYLMAGFYDQSAANDGTVEAKDPKEVFIVSVTTTVKDKKGNDVIDPVTGKPKTKKVQQKIAASPQLTHEARLAGVGIPERRFVMPVVQVAIEGCPLSDVNGNPILDSSGNPKTLIKMHVYDSAMDPHSTLADILRAAKDNELGIITAPVADLNAALRTGVDINKSDKREIAMSVIKAGIDAELLQAVSVESQQPNTQAGSDPYTDMQNMSYYRIRGDYNDIKKLVTSGVPNITYGSSTTAITNASLSSNTSAGLGNVQLLRAFTEPGEVRAESLNTGVPMLVVPAKLSISTFGCPLFSPMQRLFIDFGTGTSIDNLYNVISTETTIGKDGYKTDVTLGFADGFAQYRSLNQNLALLATTIQNAEGTTGTPSEPAAPVDIKKIRSPARDPKRVLEETERQARQELALALRDAAALEAETRAEAVQRFEAAKSAASAQVAARAEALARSADIVPEELKAKAAQAKAEVDEAARVAAAAASTAERGVAAVERVSAAITLVNTLPPEVAERVLIEAQGTLARERALAAENAQSSPQ